MPELPVDPAPPDPDAAADPAAPASWTRTPRIRTLSALQSSFVLTRNRVGRLAFIHAGRIELLPVHYVYADGRIVGRTSFSASSRAGDGASEVVFEVDEPEALFEWRSVIVRGTMQLVSPPALGEDRHTYWSAVAAFRALVPDAFTERDPTPSRRVIFTIDPTEITGREASMSFLSRTRPDAQERSHGDHV
jgi:uncharacterized protein